MSEINFEPFQKVLVRNDGEDEYPWRAALFSHQEKDGVFNASGRYWDECIPYEGNEHLLGTTDSLTKPELEFKFGDRVEVSYDHKIWLPAIFYRIRKNCRAKFCVLRPTGICSWPYCRKAN